MRGANSFTIFTSADESVLQNESLNVVGKQLHAAERERSARNRVQKSALVIVSDRYFAHDCSNG